MLCLIVYRCVTSKKEKLNSPFIYIFFVEVAFLLLIGQTDSRVYFGVQVFAYLFIVKDVLSKLVTKSKICVSLFIVLSIFTSVKALAVSQLFHKYDDKLTKKIMANKKSCILREEYDMLALQTQLSHSRYVYVPPISSDKYDWMNRGVAYYYNKTYVQMIPAFIYDQIKKKSFLQDAVLQSSFTTNSGLQIYTWKNQPYYVVPIKDYSPTAMISQRVVVYSDKKDEHLFWHQRVIRRILQIENMNQIVDLPCFSVSCLGVEYWVFEKKTNVYKIELQLDDGLHRDVYSFVRKDSLKLKFGRLRGDGTTLQ